MMQKVEQALKVDDPGVARHKFVKIVDKFLDQPKGKELQTDKKENSNVLGFKGKGSKFWVDVEAFGRGFLKEKGKPEGETEVKLRFESDCDIRMIVEWSASIIDPSGNALGTSTTLSTVFEKEKGKYKPSKYIHISSGASDIRMMEDVKFGLHKDIKEKSWLFDGALHVAVDVRFKVLEGGRPETCGIVDPFLFALRNQLENPIFPDFTLIGADGVKIKTHKLILTLQSPVFRAMFQNKLKEVRTRICKIEDAEGNSIKAMLAFLVGMEPKEWTFDMSKELFKLADKYELSELRDRSAMELAKALTTKNLVEVMLLAHRHSEKALLNEAFHFLEDNLTAATLDGVVVRLASKDVPEALVHEWQAHWYRRREGLEKPKEASVANI